MPEICFLAADWGTTNLRAWTVAPGGGVVARREFPFGVAKLARGESATVFEREVRPALDAEGVPALLCGMIGSNLGWVEVPYLPCPADLADLAVGLAEAMGASAPAFIVPGVRGVRPDGAPDVMRGEETQLLGWAAQTPERAVGRHLVCHPGTHTKWALMQDGRIERFVTAMTGELFDILGRHSVLQASAGDEDAAAFDRGLAAAGDGAALAARLFTTRSRVVTGAMPAVEARSYLSGLLIGADVAATPALLDAGEGCPIHLLGDARLCRLYARALQRQGCEADISDGEAAALAGLNALYQRRFA